MRKRILNTNVKLFNHSFSAGRILTHPLFSGSIFMVFGSNFANFIAYLYHLLFGRILGPSSYGELVTTISLIGLIMSAFSFFATVIIKFVSSAADENIPAVLGWFNRKLLRLSIILTVLMLAVSPLIGSYVHLPVKITILLAPLVFFSIISLVYRSFLQGMMKFKEVAIISNIELLGRLIFGLIFVYASMEVFGAVLGILISLIVGVFLTKFYLRKVEFSKKYIKDLDLKKIISYSLPVFVVTFSFTSLLSTDLIMVKHFFSSYDAGIYGSVSNLGKIIFYGTSPIISVMFPVIAKRKSQGADYLNVFILSAFMVIGLGSGVLILYYLFPNFIVNITYKQEFIEGSGYLILMGGYYILYSLANLMASFLLSIDLIKPLLVLPIFAIIQVVLIYIFHGSLRSVIFSSLSSVSLLLSYLGLYFAYAKKKKS